jgi:luciferase family oxidoreductase group 1
VRLSVLDLGHVLPGAQAPEVLRQIVALGPWLEQLGYRRYWFAEHHESSFVYASPEALVATVAARTQHLRVGTAGVLMHFHSPLRVAETFKALSALHQGRIDLGVAAGISTEEDRAALSAGFDLQAAIATRLYTRHVEQLVAYCRNEFPEVDQHRKEPTPLGQDGPPVICMGSGKGRGNMLIAAKNGLAFCYSLFHPGGEYGPEVIHEYIDRFQPSRDLSQPYVILATHFLCAETNNEALQQLRRAQTWQPAFRPPILGRPPLCREQGESLLARYSAHELVLMPAYDELRDRRHAYQMMAEALGALADPRAGAHAARARR